MKILLITYLPPTSQNRGGPTALLHYLIKNRPADIHLDIVCFEGHLTEDKAYLKTLWKTDFENVRFVRPRKMAEFFVKLLERLGKSFPYPPQSYRYGFSRWGWRKTGYKHELYDLVWIYPSYLIKCLKRVPEEKAIMTGPDSASLHYFLMPKAYDLSSYQSKDPMFRKKIVKYKKQLNQRIQIDRDWGESKAFLHVVGKADQLHIQKQAPQARVHFLKHPHFDYEPVSSSLVNTTGPFKILVTGANYGEYIGDFLDEIIDAIVHDGRFAGTYEFVFVGSGFEQVARILKKNRFKAEVHGWVEDYPGTIRNANIQLFPIVLGTGTKNKVLSAMAAGLLCIGTGYAFENIDVEPGKDCILIDNAKDVVNALHDVVQRKRQYSQMAGRAARKVRTAHAPKVVSKDFWSMIKKNTRLSKGQASVTGVPGR